MYKEAIKFHKVVFIVLGLLAMVFYAFSAKAYEVPKDAVIKVYDASGKQIGEMKRSEYKVVKLGTSKKPVETKQQKLDRKYKEKHNSIIVHAGPGKTGMSVRTNGTNYDVQQKEGMVFGATYCYTEQGSGICATGMTNKTVTIGVKQDF